MTIMTTITEVDGEDAPAFCVTLVAASIRITSNNGGAESPKG